MRRARHPVVLAARASAATALAVLAAAASPAPPVLAADAGASDLPRPPCGGAAPFPAYATPGAAPEVGVWTTRDLDDPDLPNVRLWAGWPSGERSPPPCSGWGDAVPFTLALAARIPDPPGGTEGVLRRLGAVSDLGDLRYWAAARAHWEPLFDDVPYAVADPTSPERRPDHAPAELMPGREVYTYQDPAGPVGGAVYRTRVREAGPDRLVAETENATTARAGGLFPLRPGTIRLVHFLDRLPDGSGWGYYGLVGLATAPDSARTYVNRAAALFRHLAGLPPEGEAPVWP